MTLKLFTQPNCPKCPAAKELVTKIKAQNTGMKIEFFNTTEADGLAEASFYSVMGTPSLIITNNQGKEAFAWRGETPSLKEVLAGLK